MAAVTLKELLIQIYKQKWINRNGTFNGNPQLDRVD